MPNKLFIIALIIAAIVGWKTSNFMNFLTIVGVYAIGRIIWNLLT